MRLLCGGLFAISLVSALPSYPARQGVTSRLLGRVNPTTRELTWPSTGITFTFTGTSASVPFNFTGTNAIAVTIDGGPAIVIDNVNTTSYTTPTLTPGQHTVVLRKKSEAFYGSIFIGQPVATGVLQPVASPKKRIEIIGDSISVGYGLDGTFPCTETAALEDAPRTYGALTAKNLSADYSIVAWSGKGLIRNYVTASPTGDDGQPTQPVLWTRYGANDADNSYDYSYQPDIVVINLGTNDFGYLLTNATTGQTYDGRAPIKEADFTTAMVNFVKLVRSHYITAEVFITSSPMLDDSYPTTADAQHTTQSNAIKAAVAELGSFSHFVDFPPQDQSVLGCDYHPAEIEHEKMAAILTSAIQDVC